MLSGDAARRELPRECRQYHGAFFLEPKENCPDNDTTMSDLRDQLRTFIAEKFTGGDTSKIKDDTSLERAHIVDSAGVLEIILFLEETFGFTVEAEEALPENFDTVSNIAAYVEKKRAA